MSTFLFLRNEHRDATETENMNPEDIYNSIKKTSADIQNLSFNSKLDNYDDVKKKNEKRDFTSQDSGIQDLRNDSPDAGDNRKGHYNPSHYQDEVKLSFYNDCHGVTGTSVVGGFYLKKNPQQNPQNLL